MLSTESYIHEQKPTNKNKECQLKRDHFKRQLVFQHFSENVLVFRDGMLGYIYGGSTLFEPSFLETLNKIPPPEKTPGVSRAQKVGSNFQTLIGHHLKKDHRYHRIFGRHFQAVERPL